MNRDERSEFKTATHLPNLPQQQPQPQSRRGVVFVSTTPKTPRKMPIPPTPTQATMTSTSSRDVTFDDDNEDDDKNRTGIRRLVPPVRYMVSFAGFLGFICVYAMRVNLSIAIIAMIDTTSNTSPAQNSTHSDIISSSEQCPARNTSSSHTTTHGEFHWDEHTKSQVLAAFFYGYVVTQLPGGYLASRFGAARVFFIGVLCTSILTLFCPLAARSSPWVLFALRVVTGLCEGVTYPSMHVLWSYWAPIEERARLVSFTISGCFFGTLIAIPISGYLANNWGWPSAFYVPGAVGCVWCVFWLLVSADRPRQHRFITRRERIYIESRLDRADSNRGDITRVAGVPWVKFLKTPAVWALCFGHFGTAWAVYAFLTEIPSYMNNVLKFNLTTNGLLSALPYLALFLVQNLSGFAADFLANRKLLNLTLIRKIFQCASCFIPAVLLVLLPTAGCNLTLANILLIAALGTTGCFNGGYFVNHVDLASEYAGILMGISNIFGSIAGFLPPLVVGYTAGEAQSQTFKSWSTFFYITAAVDFASGLAYAVFASAKRLPWLDDYINRRQHM